MKYLFLSAALLLAGVAFAQHDDENMADSEYENYSEIIQLIQKSDSGLHGKNIPSDPTLPCNQGEESFSEFLDKYRKDKDFRLSRINRQSESIAFMLEVNESYLLDAEKKYKIFSEIVPGEDDGYCIESTGEWLYMDADNVVHRESNFVIDLNPDDDDEAEGDGAEYSHFKRVNGKWMLYDIYLVG